MMHLLLAVAVLFPKPIHFVRKVDDSISAKSVTFDEYCAGNRIVTVRGARVSIADYEKQELTEIDREAGTYSVTRFAEIAKAKPAAKSRDDEKVEINVNRNVALSRDAVEALIGASYPNTRTKAHDVALNAAAPQRPGARATVASVDDAYGLPSEQTVTVEGVTMHDAIIRVTYDSAPPQVIAIDPQARRIESKITRLSKELDALERLPATSKP